MLKLKLLGNKATLRSSIEGFVLIANSFIWYFYAFKILGDIIDAANLNSLGTFAVWIVNFASTAVFALAGALATGRTKRRTNFLLAWILVGVVTSFTPTMLDSSMERLLLVVFMFGASFGIGMPSAMSYFADSTTTENRGRSGGIIFLIIGLGVFSLGMLNIADMTTRLTILAVWRGIGLLVFFLIKPKEEISEPRTPQHYSSILHQRQFALYFVPWIMFCLVNETSTPIITSYFGATFVNMFTIVEFTLSGLFAVVGGLFCDKIGRKRVAMLGFVVLGLGYAMLGVLPQNPASWYFYSVADGVAWGIFYAIFFFTIWGDLAKGAPSEKYYAIGGLPYLLSNFLRFVLGPYIAQAVPIYTLFSLASLFLFLAVLPLLYAPETLPEKSIRDRELRIYIENAQKIKEKHA